MNETQKVQTRIITTDEADLFVLEGDRAVLTFHSLHSHNPDVGQHVEFRAVNRTFDLEVTELLPWRLSRSRRWGYRDYPRIRCSVRIVSSTEAPQPIPNSGAVNP